MDLHDVDGRLERFLGSLEEKCASRENAEYIRRFMDYCFSNGLSKMRVLKYVSTLVKISRVMGKPFDRVSKEDVERFVGWVERNRRFSPWTKQNYKVALKFFFKWFKGGGERYPPEVDWIKTTLKAKDELLPEQLLTEEDVMRLVRAARSLRDKAFIITLYESGARIGEMGGMRIRDVEFNEHYATLTLKGKTGMRRVPVVASVPYLLNWIQNRPRREDPDAPLWCSLNDGKPVCYNALAKILRVAARKAGLKKNVHPHLFRHSRATFLAKRLTEAQMNVYFGWKQGSKMPSVYVHLSGRDINDSILGIYGLKEAGEEEPKLKPRICPRCGYSNAHDAQICSRCGLTLAIEQAFVTIRREDLTLTTEEIEALKRLLDLMKQGKIQVVT